MPILKQGQDVPSALSESPKVELYGVKPQTNSIMFAERLLKLFRPQDWVNIKNIDDEVLVWQYVSEDSEREEYTQGGNMRQIYRNPPEQWYIMPGDTEPVPGAAAYIGLDVLYKTVAAKKALKENKDPNDLRKMKNGVYAEQRFNFSDATIQEDTIKKAFAGVVTPNFGVPAQPTPAIDSRTSEPTARPDRWPEPADTTPKAKTSAGSNR